jgi:serine/threonine protein kinase
MRAVLTVEHRTQKPVRSQVLRMGEIFTLGRGREATIRIDDERISRRHVSIVLTPQGLEVTELGSRNGTRVNGRNLNRNERLNVGAAALIELGEARIHVQVELAGQESPITKRLAAALPDLVEDFEVLGEIGQGASGKVYVAQQRRLNRTVAIKSLKTEYVPGTAARERFLREGRLAARIHSPFVVEVYDVRVHEDRAYIIMELVQGPTAKDRLAAGPLSLAEALSISDDIAMALAAATEAHVVHRDVKPGNILLDADGAAKLADFGIAKDLNGSRIETLTAKGDGLGTLAYVSPEQAQDAKTVDYRTDIYGLGATMFHLIAGRPPFIPSSARVLVDILEGTAPRLISLRPEVPPPLDVLVASMLEKKPELRPPTAHEVARRIREVRLQLGFVRSAGTSTTMGGQAFPQRLTGETSS